MRELVKSKLSIKSTGNRNQACHFLNLSASLTQYNPSLIPLFSCYSVFQFEELQRNRERERERKEKERQQAMGTATTLSPSPISSSNKPFLILGSQTKRSVHFIGSDERGIFPFSITTASSRAKLVVTNAAKSEVAAAAGTIKNRRVNQGCKLIGSGSAVPDLLISNDDLSKIVETSDEWISVRTGIRNRRVLTGKDTLTALASEAAKKALEMGQVDADDVDLILLCTSTPEDLFGSAPQIQRALGCKSTPLSFDITAACSGFLLGLVSAASYIRGSGFKNVLVVGADSLSRYVDWTDRGTCILFGDAAGAVLLQACDADEDGLFSFDLHSDGDGQRHLNASIKDEPCDETVEGFGSNGSVVDFPPRRSSYSCIQMNGNEVFRFACRCVPPSIESSLEKAGLSSSDIDWLLLHQANQRILDAVSTRLQVPSERVISNLANYGNTSAASIPLALDEAVRSGKVRPGHLIATAGFGAGLTWGSAILRWG